MGKPKASGRKSAGESSTKQVDSKSRGIEKAKDRITRERKEKSYRETEPTDSENDEVPDVDPDAEVDSAVESDSEFGVSGNSSGSEYGKKKGKSVRKASPAKGKRPVKRASTSSPKKGGRGRGRTLKAPPKSSRNGKKKARGDSSEEEASLSDQSDDAYPPPAKVAKRKPKTSVSPKRGRGAKKAAAGSDDESSAPPRRGGRQRTEIKYKAEDSDEESDPNDKIIPGASSAKKPASTGSGRGRGRKPAAAKTSPAKKAVHSDDEDKSGSDEDAAKPLSSKNKKAPASNSDEGSDSDEKMASTSNKPMARKAAAASRAKTKNAESSEGEEEDESYGKSKKVVAPARKAAAKKPAKADSESGEEDSDMDEAPLRKAGPAGRKPTAAATATLKSKDSDDSESEEKSPPPKKEGLFDELKSKTQAESDSDSALSEDKIKKDVEKKENSVEKNDVDKSRNRNGDGEKEDDLVSVSSKDGSEGSNGKAKVLKNRTDTDFSSIDFTCDKKTASGEEWNFKISCWNVSGIKSWVSKNGLEYLKRESPDIMCLQEVKCTEKTAPSEVKSIEGYPHSFWNYSANAGQSGVAILSKTEPKDVSYGIPITDDDSDEDKKYKELFNKEGRLLVAEYEDFFLFNAYVPNSGRGATDASHPKPYPGRIINGERLGWDKVFRQYVKAKDAVKPVIVVGDLNVAHDSIDLANPATNTSTAGFTKEERESFTNLLEQTQLFDSFRSLYPKQTGAYSYWSYMRDARTKNIGWRLDYFLLSEKLRGSLCENLMRSDVYGSDHCPIVLFARI